MKKFNVLVMLLAITLIGLTGCKSENKEVKNPGEPIRFASQNDEEGYVLLSLIHI